MIAHDGDKDLGAVWLRFWTETNHSYGFVTESIPELGIGVVAEHRRKRIGRALIRELVRIAAQRNIHKISLSVEQDNFSRQLYVSEGFKTVDQFEDSDTMLYTARRQDS